MNSRALKDRIKNIAHESNLDPQALMQNYFLERLLARISHSSYREEDDYCGIRVRIDAIFERVIQRLKIDLSTGDSITPRDIKYEYKTMFDDEVIQIQAYNIETIIAEKYETALRRGSANTRMRDFYDLYELKVLKEEEINHELLKLAFGNTVKKRGSEKALQYAGEILNDLKESDKLRSLWKAYQTTYPYAQQIEYEKIMDVFKWYFHIIR